MLRLLLDEHFQAQVAQEVRRHDSAIAVESMNSWEYGSYLGVDDSLILDEAYRQGRTLVTRDLRTISPLLKSWGEQGKPHGGVIFVDNRSLPEGNIGALVAALLALWDEYGSIEWANVTLFLKR